MVNKTIAKANPSALKAKYTFGYSIHKVEKLTEFSFKKVLVKTRVNPKATKLKNKATRDANLSPDKKVTIVPIKSNSKSDVTFIG